MDDQRINFSCDVGGQHYVDWPIVLGLDELHPVIILPMSFTEKKFSRQVCAYCWSVLTGKISKSNPADHITDDISHGIPIEFTK